MKAYWKQIQRYAQVTPDGIPGPNTAKALMKKLGLSLPKYDWPSQAEVRSGQSVFMQAGCEKNLCAIHLPYPMSLSWQPEQYVHTIRCHKLIAANLTRIFQYTLNHYGLATIHELGLDVFGGCYNNRSIIGGRATSMHAWGIAIDLDPANNSLNTHAPKARFSAPEYDAFWQFVEDEGAVSLGRQRDCDWMHFQFASL